MNKSLSLVLLTIVLSSATWASPVQEVTNIIGIDVPINLAWDEGSDGDLGDILLGENSPTLDLQIGLNLIVGSWDYSYVPTFGGPKDFDSFNFTLPTNAEISAVIYAFDVVLFEGVHFVAVEHTLVSDTDCDIYDYNCYQSFRNDPKDYFLLSKYPKIYDVDPCAYQDPCPWEDNETIVTFTPTSDIHIFDFDGKIPFKESNGGISYSGFPAYLMGDPFPAKLSLDYAWGLVVHSLMQPVDIVVNPDDESNCININDRGVIPVVILGAEELDITQIDRNTLTFGSMPVAIKKKGPMCGLKLLNDDGYRDLVCHFQDNASLWDITGGVAELSGFLLDGTEISGTTDVCIDP